MQIIYFLVVTLAYLFLQRWIMRATRGATSALGQHRRLALYIRKVLQIALTIVYLSLLGLLIGIQYSEVTLFLSSVFAIVGVALFAQWSILSNLTASLVIFFGMPYRIGDRIRVMDRDDSVTGVIEEISLFCVQVRDDNKNLATFPNNMFLQRAVIKLEHPEPVRVIPATSPSRD